MTDPTPTSSRSTLFPDASRRVLAHLERAQALSNTGSWEWDIASGEILWSNQIFRIFGRDPATFAPSYQAFLACVHPADREAVSAG